MNQRILIFYLAGFLLGILTATHAILFVRIGFAIKNKIWRRLWAYSYLVHLWLIVQLLGWVLNLEFAVIRDRAARGYFIGFWLLPYFTSVVWCLWKYRDRLKRKP